MASKTSAKHIKTKERRKRVLELRKQGYTYDAITDVILSEFAKDDLPSGYDHRQAWQDVKRELAKLQEDITETVEHIKTIEAQRLERLFNAHYQKATDEQDKNHAELCVKIHDRIMKLHGLDVHTVGIDPNNNKIELTVKYDR